MWTTPSSKRFFLFVFFDNLTLDLSIYDSVVGAAISFVISSRVGFRFEEGGLTVDVIECFLIKYSASLFSNYNKV